jgi:hypothetical protein
MDIKKNNYAVVEVISVVISVFMILTIISAIMLCVGGGSLHGGD